MGKASFEGRLVVGSCMALIAGYSDVVSFLLWEEFAGMQTGNMVFMGKALLGGDPRRALYNVAVMASNMGGVMAFCLLKDLGGSIRLAAPLVAGLTLISEFLNVCLGTNHWHVCFLSAGLGAQNFLGFTEKIGGMTALATGNLQKTAKALYHVLRGHHVAESDKESALVALGVVLATIAGAILGATVLNRGPIGARWLLFPVAALQFVVLFIHDSLLADDVAVDHAPFLDTTDEDPSSSSQVATNPVLAAAVVQGDFSSCT